MAQFKVLVLVVAVITSLSSCKGTQSSSMMSTGCNEIVVYNSQEKFSIRNTDYELISNDVGFDLRILNSNFIQLLKKIENPTFELCVENKRYVAKGNDLLSSKVPAQADYFFPLNQQKKIDFFKNNLISFRKI